MHAPARLLDSHTQHIYVLVHDASTAYLREWLETASWRGGILAYEHSVPKKSSSGLVPATTQHNNAWGCVGHAAVTCMREKGGKKKLRLSCSITLSEALAERGRPNRKIEIVELGEHTLSMLPMKLNGFTKVNVLTVRGTGATLTPPVFYCWTFRDYASASNFPIDPYFKKVYLYDIVGALA